MMISRIAHRKKAFTIAEVLIFPTAMGRRILKQSFHDVAPQTKSRQNVGYDIKRVEKHWSSL